MLTEVGTALTEIIGWAGDVLSAVVTEAGALHALLPLWAVGIAVSGVYGLSVKYFNLVGLVYCVSVRIPFKSRGSDIKIDVKRIAYGCIFIFRFFAV